MTRSTAADRAGIARQVTEAIVEIVPTVDPATVRGDQHLKDLGADSVDRVEIISVVLDRLGLTEPLASFSGLPDIDAMVDLLHDRSVR